jgi:hypothetical protein
MHEFLIHNRDELIRRCEAKVAQRPRRAATPGQLKNGVGVTATLHGKQLLELGYTVDQVVHDYGD